jgi:hypothetical protein
MSDSPMDIASATIQFMGFRSAFDDILQVIRFTQSSQEHKSDLSWLVGSARWELESLDQWGRYVGLYQDGSGSTTTAKPPLLASLSAWRRIIDILAGCRSTIFELEELLPHNTGGMQIPAHPTLETLQYTEKVTNSVAVVAAMGSYDSGGHQSSTLERILNCFTQNKERIKELVDRLAASNRRLKEEIPNPDMFYRWLASAFGELEIDELQQLRPSDAFFRRFLDALIFEKQNSYLLKSNHVDNDFKMKLPSAPKMVNAPPGSRTRGLARSVAGRWVLIEWKRVVQTTPGFRLKVKKRLDNLARCLHPGEKSQRSDFHMMSCDGWFEDVDSCWLGIVYQLPASVDYEQEPLSLADIMDDRQFPPPSLGMRFKLAYQLAISLQKYHASKWFHKAFNSSNILFFFDQTSGELRLEEPYVVGFGSSRHKKLDATGTEGVDPDTNDYASLYQHPGVVKGFRAAYDVYALGCIMLELAHWKTLVSLKEEFQPQQTSNQTQTWVEALEEMASYLGPKVGEVYEYAVGWCLCDVVTIREDKAIAHFFRQIVEAPLASLNV